MRSFYLLTLGCPKNTVDSEAMSGLLTEAGWHTTARTDRADVLIVNTCGFIEPARRESYAALEELAKKKRPGQVLLAAGCLSQRHGDELRRTVPGVDGILGTREWASVVECVERLLDIQPEGRIRPKGEVSVVAPMRRHVQGTTAYLKIADGCSAPCAFCAIPLIKGPQHSKARSAIVDEARQLVDQGVREIILIAQDTTSYGRDLGQTDALPTLIENILDAAPELSWLRLMYAYPQHITTKLIDTIAAHSQVCHYLDMPLQHAHPDTLRRMARSPDVDAVRRLIERVREAMPDIALRTTFIVGYPGETEEEFAALLAFLDEVRFDRVGIFIYSPEEGTRALTLPHPVPREVAEDRYAQAMEQQRGISLQLNQQQVGHTLDVLVEGAEQGITVGRSYRDAPEIDGYVLMDGEWAVGQMIQARIDSAMAYDLQGRVIRGHST